MKLMDVIAIIAIIAFSFLFTLKETKYLNHQLLFVVMALVVILFYKILYYNNTYNNSYNVNNLSEGFQNAPERLNNAISKIQEFRRSMPDADIELTDQQTDKLQEQTEEINKSLNEVKYLLSEFNSGSNVSKEQGTGKDPIGSLNLNASQIIQDKELDMVEKQLDQVKANLISIENQKKEKKYKKIPVYSSCVVSEANGSYSVEQPGSGNIVSDYGSQVSSTGVPITSRRGGNGSGVSSGVDTGNVLASKSVDMGEATGALNSIIERGLTINLQ